MASGTNRRKVPMKRNVVTAGISLPPEEHAAGTRLAKREKRSFSWVVLQALRNYLKLRKAL